MRTHVWRKQLVRLSQRNQRLPFQRRRPFSTSVRRQDDSHNQPGAGAGSGIGTETTTQEAQTDAVNKPVSSGGRRRAGYARRTKEVTPFSVPDWFLRHNVRLHAPNPDAAASGETACWTLVDKDTGHTVLTLPFSKLPQPPKNENEPSLHFFTPSTTESGPESSDNPSNQSEQPTDESSDKPSDQSEQPSNQSEQPTNQSEPPSNQSEQRPGQAHENPSLPRGQSPVEQVGPTRQVPVGRAAFERFVDNTTKRHNADDDANQDKAEQKDVKDDKASTLDSEKIKRATRRLAPTPDRHIPDARTLVSLQLQLLLEAAFSLAGPASARFAKPNIDLQTRDFFAHKELDAYVAQIAQLVGADVITLDASDIADLGQDYVDAQDTEPGSISSLAYDTFKNVSAAKVRVEIIDDSADDDANEPDDSMREKYAPDKASPNFKDFLNNKLEKALASLGNSLGAEGALIPIALGDLSKPDQQAAAHAQQPKPSVAVSSWDELKLQTLLDTLLDSVHVKRDSPAHQGQTSFLFDSAPDQESDASQSLNKTAFERLLVDYLKGRIDSTSQSHSMSGEITDSDASPTSPESPRRTIIHIRDMDHIRNQPQGDAIINRLIRVVQKRRKDGQQMVIFGTTASSSQALPSPGEEDDELYFRTLTYPSSSTPAHVTARQLILGAHMQNDRSVAEPGYHRIFDVNLRHIHSMIRRLALPMSDTLFASDTRSHLNVPGTFRLGDDVLNQDEVQRIVLCAESLRSLYTKSPSLETFHIAFATMLTHTIDATLQPLMSGNSIEAIIPSASRRGRSQDESSREGDAPKSKLDMEKLKKTCSKHETRLLSGVVDPLNIKTTFNEVHADKSTIESLKTLTSLTLLRPEAFSYGILAADRLPGLLLYGPPGTGKTLLAKAVAKESSATVLEVSGAQIYEKYVGEGEKMVKAVFSLAKKLSPCVVFIDEADALFGSRGGASRSTHREIINQFLREWDGMDDHSVFMMVATNRPFDLDDAVLRRLPRRLLVDLPLSADRESILKIHLKDETLDASVSLSDLAKNTPLYSGSDLKNLCVSAALAAVRDENTLLEKARSDGDAEFKLPERRTLQPTHFEKALQEISASVSEDMATLGAIRKFDEQYGERRSRTKKAGWGFGVGGSNVIDETGARVRPDEPSRGT